MSKAAYWQRGESLDYINNTDITIEANTIVTLVGRIGIAGTDIKPGQKGDIHVSGVFEFSKTSSNAILLGTPVYFDGTGITESADNGETGDDKTSYTPAGYVAEESIAGAQTILVKIG